MLEPKDMTATTPAVTFRDGDGAVRPEFVERVREGIERQDAAALRQLTGSLHEADTGDLIEALDPDLRPTFIELMGREFDFSALTEVDDTVREEILEEVPPEAIAEGVRDLDSDDAAYILEDLPEQEQAEILEQMPPPGARRARAHPALPGRLGRPPDADRIHRGAAGLDRGPGHRLHARHGGPAGPFLRALRGRRVTEAARARSRSTGCCGPSVRCRSPI